MLNNPKLRLGASLWLLAMIGVVIVVWTTLPHVLAKAPRQVPLGLVLSASILQSGLLLAAAVWAGIALGKPLGLGAPVIEAAWTRTGAWLPLRRLGVPAAAVGALVGVQLALAPTIAPAEVINAARTVNIDLAAKMLYGGITEEVLMRWGLMSAMIWLPWRIWQRKAGSPKPAYVVGAIVLTGVLFGVGHLPAAMAMGIELRAPVIAYIVVGNTLPGALFGVLYWRHGIEAAMAAHALAHLISTVAANV
jgi:hypothetical protein